MFNSQIPSSVLTAATGLLAPFIPDLTVEKLKSLSDRETESIESRPLLKIKEAASLLGISRIHISRLAAKGELQRINVGIEKHLYRITPKA